MIFGLIAALESSVDQTTGARTYVVIKSAVDVAWSLSAHIYRILCCRFFDECLPNITAPSPIIFYRLKS